jgi:hypothetical protein
VLESWLTSVRKSRVLAPNQAIGIGAGVYAIGRYAGSVFLEVFGLIIVACAATDESCATTTQKVGTMHLRFDSKKKMLPKRDFAVRPALSIRGGGPPQQGAIGLPTGQRQGVTTSFSLLNMGEGRMKIAQAGALQFGGAPMGAQKRTVNT